MSDYMKEHGYVRTRNGQYYKPEEIRASLVRGLTDALGALSLAQECSHPRSNKNVKLMLKTVERLLKLAAKIVFEA